MTKTLQRDLDAIKLQSAQVQLELEREILLQSRIETARVRENAKRDGIPLAEDLK